MERSSFCSDGPQWPLKPLREREREREKVSIGNHNVQLVVFFAHQPHNNDVGEGLLHFQNTTEEEMIFRFIMFSKMLFPGEDGFVVNGHIVTMYNARVFIRY